MWWSLLVEELLSTVSSWMTFKDSVYLRFEIKAECRTQFTPKNCHTHNLTLDVFFKTYKIGKVLGHNSLF